MSGGGRRCLRGGRYFFSVVMPPPAFLAWRRGLSANHQMLAIVPNVTAAAATGLTTFLAPLFGMKEETTGLPG